LHIATHTVPRARRRALTLSLTLDDPALARALGAIERAARGVDPRAHVTVVDPVHELPWTELSFVAVDVVTTGFVAGTDRVIEVAWVRFDRGRETERFSSLLRVDVDVPAAVRRITGIHPGMLADRPVFADVAPGLLEALATVDFAVAYNARFDRSFLAAELQRMNVSAVLPDVPWVDPLAFVRDLESRPTRGRRGDGSGGDEDRLPKGLVDVARRFGVALPHAHRAENDARATGELLLRLAPRLQARTLADLIDSEARWTRLADLSPPPSARAARDEPRHDEEAAPQGIGTRLIAALFR
jgi:DNA polymerase III epsilon subunit-like protein